MLLAADVGNTHIVLGLYEGEKLVHDFRMESALARSVDEYQVLLHQLLAVAGFSPEEVTASILASVVPPLTEPLVEAIDRAFGRQTLLVGPGIKTGMKVLYENPKEVGADRIVNAVAAFERFGGEVIVVDFGTATTFDCVSDKAEYLGGVIAPGIRISADALTSRAAKLMPAEIAKPPRVIGRNMIHSMQSGLIYGYVGLVDGLVRRIRSEMSGECPVVATGGLAELIAGDSETIEEVDEYLTLDGLRILHDRNQGDTHPTSNMTKPKGK